MLIFSLFISSQLFLAPIPSFLPCCAHYSLLILSLSRSSSLISPPLLSSCFFPSYISSFFALISSHLFFFSCFLLSSCASYFLCCSSFLLFSHLISSLLTLFFTSCLQYLLYCYHLISSLLSPLFFRSHLVPLFLIFWVTVSLNMKSAVAPLARLLVHAGISVCVYEPIISVPLNGFISDGSSCSPSVHSAFAALRLVSCCQNDSWLLDDGNSVKPPRNRLKWLILAGQTVSMWSLACGAVKLDWTLILKIVK